MDKALIRVIIYSILVALLVNFAVPQETVLLTLSTILIIIYFIIPVFILGVSDLRERFYDHHERQLIIPLISVLIPYLFIGLLGGEFLGFGQVILWYLLPSIFLILPNYVKYTSSKNNILSSILFITGAEIGRASCRERV